MDGIAQIDVKKQSGEDPNEAQKTVRYRASREPRYPSSQNKVIRKSLPIFGEGFLLFSYGNAAESVLIPGGFNHQKFSKIKVDKGNPWY